MRTSVLLAADVFLESDMDFKQLLFIYILCSCLYLCVSRESLITLVFLCVTSAARSAVLEWQVVTVAWFHSSKSCMGAPTILLRPITTALFPATETPVEKRTVCEFTQVINRLLLLFIYLHIIASLWLTAVFSGLLEILFTRLFD